MIEKSIRKIMNRMRDMHCEHTSMQKVQNRAFLIWLKSVREIRSISMRKDQIFSALFVFFDRVSALQDRICNDCIIRFSETILCDFIEFRVCNRFLLTTVRTARQYASSRLHWQTVFSLSSSRIYRTTKSQE